MRRMVLRAIGSARSHPIAGDAPGTDRGYFSPVPATLRAARAKQTGSYSLIRTSDEKDILTRPFLSVWFDHGADPQNATCAHVLLPGETAAQTEDYARRPEVRILENSESAQAVEKPCDGEPDSCF